MRNQGVSSFPNPYDFPGETLLRIIPSPLVVVFCYRAGGRAACEDPAYTWQEKNTTPVYLSLVSVSVPGCGEGGGVG